MKWSQASQQGLKLQSLAFNFSWTTMQIPNTELIYQIKIKFMNFSRFQKFIQKVFIESTTIPNYNTYLFEALVQNPV